VKFAVTILGSGAAVPTLTRNPSAHHVVVRERCLLFDCAEGTQLQLKKYGLKLQRLSHIFISHLHGDHYYGLIGLLTSFHLLGRAKELHLYGNQGLEEILEVNFRHSKTILNYPLIFHPVNNKEPEIILDDKRITVESIPLNHSVPTTGFLISEKTLRRKISREFIAEHNIPIPEINSIKNGDDYTDPQGNFHKNSDITSDPDPPRKYAYLTDTAYDESVVHLINGVDLLYHEATFMHDMAANATGKLHATARQAAEIALKANARRLVLGHFSARYNHITDLLSEAREIFPDTLAASDGMFINLDF